MIMGDPGLEHLQQNIPQPLDNKEDTAIQRKPLTGAKVQDRVHGPEFPPDLQKVIDQWKHLPESIKETIMNLIRTVKKV